METPGRDRWRFRTDFDDVVVVAAWEGADAALALPPHALLGCVRAWLDDPLARADALALYRELVGASPHHPRDAWPAADVAARLEQAFARGELVALRVPARELGTSSSEQSVPVGRAPAPAPAPAPAAAPPAAPPPAPAPAKAAAPAPVVPKIVAVAWLDGNDAFEGGGKQWVNLPKDNKWVDIVNVANPDRLGRRPRVKVRFDRPGAHPFKVKMVPGGSNVVYTGAEKGRNANFLFEETEKSYTTDGDGTKIIPADFFVAASGKATYALAAKDANGVEVRSQDITTHRLVYFKEIKMRGLTTTATSLATFTGEFAKHNVTLLAMGSAEMDFMANVANTDEATFKTKARAAYAGSNASTKHPYVVALAYTDHLAVKDASQTVLKAGVDVGPGKPAVDVPIVNAAGSSKYLWKNIVPGEDWFVSATFLRDGGASPADDVAIPAAKCAAVPVSAGKPDMCRTVRVDVTGLAAARGTITLKVNWVNRMRAGLSFGGGNLICVCTRAWWEAITTAEQNQVLVHEMGHKVGMVPEGTGTGTDATPSQYTGSGHVGSHCHKGVAAAASYSGAAGSTCVMFGETNGVSAFCDECAPAVKKQDLVSGWSAF